MRVRRFEKKMKQHRLQPTFVEVLDGLKDMDTGISVLLVQYDDDAPAGELSGEYVEVFDEKGNIYDSALTTHWGDDLHDLLEQYVEMITGDGTGRQASRDLRSKVIRLAHQKPELRPHLLPLLQAGAKAASTVRPSSFKLNAVYRLDPSQGWGDLEGLWFLPREEAKGGKFKGLLVEKQYSRRVPEKAKITYVGGNSLSWPGDTYWEEVGFHDLPNAVQARFTARM